ncbi:MAG TPA: hypothetical protein VFD56_05965 [Chitinophagaceae bacterium]|nr:hypothetical protein [Chitinophagaceae bacterium]
MNRKLKDFIEENRRAFDDEMPSPGGWHQIEKTIGVIKPARKLSIKGIYKWSAVAAVFLMIVAGAYWLMIDKNDPATDTLKTTASPGNTNGNGTDISRIAPEYAAEAKKIYLAIEKQQEQLKIMAEKQPELYSQFAQDLATLDSSYRVLKVQAVQTPSREVIIKAMLQNLQLQAELLSKQLLIIDELNKNKNDNHEKNNNRSI